MDVYDELFKEVSGIPEIPGNELEEPDPKDSTPCPNENEMKDLLQTCFEGLEPDDLGNEVIPLETLLNDTGSARKWFNALSRPARQFLHIDDMPNSVVNWTDNRINTIPKEVDTVLIKWKTDSQLSSLLHQKQMLSGYRHGQKFPRPEYMSKLEPVKPKEQALLVEEATAITDTADTTEENNDEEESQASSPATATPTKIPNIVLGTYQPQLKTARTEEDKKVMEIVNSLPDLSFLLIIK